MGGRGEGESVCVSEREREREMRMKTREGVCASGGHVVRRDATARIARGRTPEGPHEKASAFAYVQALRAGGCDDHTHVTTLLAEAGDEDPAMPARAASMLSCWRRLALDQGSAG